MVKIWFVVSRKLVMWSCAKAVATCLTLRGSGQEHHITVPLHSPMRIGTLNQILTEVATHLEISKDELIRRLL
jgi:hypothetical protein